MPIIERNIDELQKQAAVVQRFTMTDVEEAAVLGNAQYETEAGKNLKTKLKLEAMKKEQDRRKQYGETIHNTVSRNIINSHKAIASYTVKVSETKLHVVTEVAK